MKAVTFSGGVHPDYEKDRTKGLAIEALRAPKEAVIPLSQHIGAPAKACVEKGDEVLLGQVIGEPGGFVSQFIHASVSGKVTAVEPRIGAAGVPILSVVIENDGEDREIGYRGIGDAWQSSGPDELRELIRKAGLVGMGGAAFPTHVKLSPPKGKTIDTLIVNGAECEPYLTADHRVMLERSEAVVTGTRILGKTLNTSRCIIAIEQNKPDAIQTVRDAARGTNIEVVSCRVKYPQGAEKQLIEACLGRQVPSGGLPMDVRVVVQNVGTAAFVTDAVVHGRPLVERVVTVTGSAVQNPANLSIRIGTPMEQAIQACGGLRGELGKLIAGGPMMGLSQYTDQVPVTKGTSGILLLAKDEVPTAEPGPCIRCGRCSRACPMRLVPTDISTCSDKGMIDKAEEFDALDCIECGSCAFDCPAGIPLVQKIRLAKAAIVAAKQKKGQ